MITTQMMYSFSLHLEICALNFTFRGSPIRLTGDFSLGSLQPDREWRKHSLSPWKVLEAQLLSSRHMEGKAESVGQEKSPAHGTHKWQMPRNSSIRWPAGAVCSQTARDCTCRARWEKEQHGPPGPILISE